MDDLEPQPIDDSTSIAEEVSTCSSWGDDDSNDEFSNEESDDLLADVGDEEFWAEDNAAVTWLASYPGGTPLLYPELFVVKPRRRGGVFITPSRHSNGTVTFLQLPSDIRNRIYEDYFDIDVEVKHPEEERAPFHDRDGK